MESTALIALIDTVVDTSFLPGRVVEHIDLCAARSSATSNDGASGSAGVGRISHGTACAMILDRCATNFELLCIRIFEESGGKVFGEIGLLEEALRLCVDRHVDIVSLSSVSSLLSDSRYLYDTTLELARTATIVSALDNRRFVTVPTSYPHVVGVQCDRAGALAQGELAYSEADPFGANVYANCGFEFMQAHQLRPSNSFAVPVVAAYVNDLVNQGYSAQGISYEVRNLKPYSAAYAYEAASQPVLLGEGVPIAMLSCYTNEMCTAMMDSLFEGYEVQSAALSLVKGGYDVRIREIYDIADIKDSIHFIERHYKTDIIFIVCGELHKEAIKQQIEIDAELQYQGSGCVAISCGGFWETVSAAAAASRLHDILTD